MGVNAIFFIYKKNAVFKCEIFAHLNCVIITAKKVRSKYFMGGPIRKSVLEESFSPNNESIVRYI
jgi:hypothetical protein